MKGVSIIIPSIKWENFTEHCVTTCLKLFPESDIILLLDETYGVTINAPNLHVIQYNGTIAAKRNKGASIANVEFIAFIDSDAYPHSDWLSQAIYSFESDDAIGIVGGPNVSPPIQETERELVGMATRSWLVAGKWNFYKYLDAAPRYCDNLPSCNMVMRKSFYETMGCMNENMELGEDTDLCARVISFGKRIYFNPKAIVYHYDRKIAAYLNQRIIRGAGVYLLIFKSGEQKKKLYTYLLLQPVATLLFLLNLPLVFFIPVWKMLTLPLLSIYLLLIVYETIKQAKEMKHIPVLFLLITTGNILPGLGFLLNAFGLLPSLPKIYRNDT